MRNEGINKEYKYVQILKSDLCVLAGHSQMPGQKIVSYLFIIKMSAHLMLDQISLSSRGKPSKHLKLLYSYKDLDPTSELQQFKRYLHSLTYDLRSPHPPEELSNEDVYRLKQNINHLYQAYQKNQCRLPEVQGIWPLLTFNFPKMSGLELYLCFQNLIEPIHQSEKQPSSEKIKEEHIQFDPKQYFQSVNYWMKDTPFMKALRVLQRNFSSSKGRQNILTCSKILKLIIKEEIELLMQCKDMQQQFQLFKAQLSKVARGKELIKKSKMLSALDSKAVFGNVVVSDPGDLNHILEYFSKEQYLKYQSYQHQDLIPLLPVKERCQSAANSEPQQQELGPSELKIKKQATQIHSSPTKRRIAHFEENDCNMSMATPPRPRRLNLRCPRYKIIERMYDAQPKKNLIIKELKNEILQQRTFRKRTEKIEKCRRRKLKKINEGAYYSDEEELVPKKTKKSRRMSIQQMSFIEESSYVIEEGISEPEPERMDIQSSEEITMRRKPTKNRAIDLIRQREMNFYEQIPDKYLNSHRQQLISQRSFNFPPIQNTNLLRSRQSSSFNSFHKNDPLLRYLQPRFSARDERMTQTLDQLEIKKLNLYENDDLFMKIDIYEYIKYLRLLEGKEIRKEVLSVSKQLLVRQHSIIDIDMTLKALGLFVLAQETCKQSAHWQPFRCSYIEPMLRYCIAVNVSACIADILNNFSGSHYEDLSLVRKIKILFLSVFEVANGFQLIKPKLIQMIYQSLPTPSALEHQSSNSQLKSFINLKNPFTVGARILKFKLCSKDSTIATLLGTFVFQQLILSVITSADTSSSQSVEKYFKTLQKWFSDQKQSEISGQLYYTLVETIRQFYNCYQPQLRKEYFLGLLEIVNLSLKKLSGDLIQKGEKMSYTLNLHLQLIQAIYKDYINYYVSKNDYVNANTLMSILIKHSLIKDYKTIVENNKLTMILFPRVITLFWQREELRNTTLYSNTISKYLDEQIKHNLQQNTKSIIMLTDPTVARTIFDLLSIIYKSIFKRQLAKQDFNHDFALRLAEKEAINSQSYLQIREIIQAVFKRLDNVFKERLALYNNSTKELIKAAITNLEIIEDTIITFLSNFIFPTSQLQMLCEETILKYSASHYLFGLKFVLNQNCFLSYFKARVPEQVRTHRRLLDKCNEVLSYYFVGPPDFFKVGVRLGEQQGLVNKCGIELQETTELIRQKEFYHLKYLKNYELTRAYYQLIFNHCLSLVPQQRQLEIVVLKEVSDRRYLQTLSSIFTTYLIAALEIMETKQRCIGLNTNPIFKFIQQSTNPNTITSNKLSTAITLLRFAFQKLIYYILLAQRDRQNVTAQPKHADICKLKEHFFMNFIYKLIKEVTTIIITGSALKNRGSSQEAQHYEVIRSMSVLKLVSENMIQQLPREAGYLYFLNSIQESSSLSSLSDIFCTFLELYKGKERIIGPALWSILKQIHTPIRKLLLIEQDKSPLILEAITILTFILSWEDPNPECVKKYLNDMQILSKGESMLSKIEITQSNLAVLLQLFSAIENNKYNFYHMKDTLSAYSEMVCCDDRLKSANPDKFYRNIRKLLLCLQQIIKKKHSLVIVGLKLCSSVVQKLCAPVLNWQFSPTTEIHKRLVMFLELMKVSELSRKCYEVIVIEKKDQLAKCIKMIDSTAPRESVKIYSFQQIVAGHMIGRYSDFVGLRSLVSGMMKQSLITNARRQYFSRILNKLIVAITQSNGNNYILEWCRQQLQQLNTSEEQARRLCEWMDIEQS